MGPKVIQLNGSNQNINKVNEDSFSKSEKEDEAEGPPKEGSPPKDE